MGLPVERLLLKQYVGFDCLPERRIAPYLIAVLNLVVTRNSIALIEATTCYIVT